jgi:hypothetical protein
MRLSLAWLAAGAFYAVVGVVLLVPFAMGECLPRGDPNIYLCDAEKRREFWLYAGVFFLNPIIAALIARRRSSRVGVGYLVLSGWLPFAATLAFALIASLLI